MTEKELEKHNFLTWCKYADDNDVDKTKWSGGETRERLYSEYANDIEVISKTKHLYESTSQHEIGIQKFDLSLQISI